jgi:glutamate-cysteine ligase
VLAESAIGAVGLEIESHLVDLDHVADPVPWKRVETIAAVVGKVAPGSPVTVEPGGQIELSGPPAAGVAPAVARLRDEGTGVRLALADRRLGLACTGADPARPSRGSNPRPADYEPAPPNVRSSPRLQYRLGAGTDQPVRRVILGWSLCPSSLKKAAMSRLSRSGSSAEGKWPPLGIGVHRRML